MTQFYGSIEHDTQVAELENRIQEIKGQLNDPDTLANLHFVEVEYLRGQLVEAEELLAELF